LIIELGYEKNFEIFFKKGLTNAEIWCIIDLENDSWFYCNVEKKIEIFRKKVLTK